MKIVDAPVKEKLELDHNIFLFKLYCPEIASEISPGEFLNIRVSTGFYPLLRRPFSICDVQGDFIYIMFNIFGEGTKALASKKIDDTLDILGPLGKGFDYKSSFSDAIIVGGGLGAAPFPFLIRKLSELKNVFTFIGGKTEKDIIRYGMKNLQVATDDGSVGFKGNVVELLAKKFDELNLNNPKIFACGPNVMLKALKSFAIDYNIECEVSTECAMACGFGICQGCPIESAKDEDKYFLVCKDGPVFNVKDIIL